LVVPKIQYQDLRNDRLQSRVSLACCVHLVDVLSAGIVLTRIICFVSMKSRSVQCNVQNGTVVKYRHIAFGDSFHCKLFGTSNLPSNNVMIEPLMP
jgi:hypothetical protein